MPHGRELGWWLPSQESLFSPHKDGLTSYSHILLDGGGRKQKEVGIGAHSAEMVPLSRQTLEGGGCSYGLVIL